MDRLESMSVLLAAVEAGSLSAAGRRLGLPLTTVSRRISELEARLRARLLNRSSRRLTVTDAGRAYVAACRSILADVEEAERAARGEYSAPRGTLAVTAPIVFGRLNLLPIVTEFLRAYPDIDLRLTLADHVVDLQEGRLDAALRIGALPDSSLAARRVGAIRRVVCASPAYLAARGTPRRPADLASHDCIAFSGLVSSQSWSFGVGTKERSVLIRARLVVNTAEAAVDAAVAGTGVTRLLSYQVADALKTGRLRRLLRDFEPSPIPVSLVHAGQGRMPLKLRAFIDFAAPRLEGRLRTIGD